MSDFLKYVLWMLKNSLILVLPLLFVGAGVLWAVRAGYRKRHGSETPFPWGKAALYILLAAYLTVLVYATLMRFFGGWREVSLHPFRAWREAWNDFSVKSWANILLNIGLFVPAGFLAPMLWKPFRKWYRSIPLGFGLSLAVELVQLALARGICDVDDLIANTLGTALGFFLAMGLLGLKNRKQLLTYGALVLGLLLLIALPFGLYGIQPYGNLPSDPAYRLETGNVQWSLACTLPQAESTAPVYQTKKLSNADCRALADTFASVTDSVIGVETFYQEMAYYNLMYSGILQVYYHDGSWEYSGGWYEEDKTQWADLDRTQVETALAAFPLSIPASAEFAAQGKGRYSFTCDAQRTGDTLLDGSLQCRIQEDGTVIEIESGLISYTFCADASIRSAEEAWDQVQKGWFKDEFGFEYAPPASVSATDCTLVYRIDTKGFYQPVWQFTLEANNGYSGYALIRAMDS